MDQATDEHNKISSQEEKQVINTMGELIKDIINKIRRKTKQGTKGVPCDIPSYR